MINNTAVDRFTKSDTFFNKFIFIFVSFIDTRKHKYTISNV